MQTSQSKAIKMGAALALAAAGMMATVTPAVAGNSSQADVHCYGVNKCKGHNDCKTAQNACKGHAACKGQGFITMPASSCDHLGGSVKG